MSYDLMVFDPDAAPRDRDEFLRWYDVQTEWSEGHSYDDPEVTTPALASWFKEMAQTFPPMNGPLASNEYENPKVTDYSIGALEPSLADIELARCENEPECHLWSGVFMRFDKIKNATNSMR